MYMTDSESNVKDALKDQSWFGCCRHNLNLVLMHLVVILKTLTWFKYCCFSVYVKHCLLC